LKINIKKLLVELLGGIDREDYEKEREAWLDLVPHFPSTDPLTLNQYQAKAAKYLAPKFRDREYLALGLAGETGEVCEHIKKIIRGTALIDDALMEEIGDVLWFLSQLALFYNMSLEKVASNNLYKLYNREKEGFLYETGQRLRRQ